MWVRGTSCADKEEKANLLNRLSVVAQLQIDSWYYERVPVESVPRYVVIWEKLGKYEFNFKIILLQ